MRPNMVWAVNFEFDVTTDGRPIKIVSIIDEHTRECLNINTFWSVTHARVVIADWKEEYNHHRHSALGYQAPAKYAAVSTHR
jgi:hypothetical protein